MRFDGVFTKGKDAQRRCFGHGVYPYPASEEAMILGHFSREAGVAVIEY